MKKGTYVGLRVLPHSAKDITTFASKTGIPIDRSKFERRLHTTLIYSRKYSPAVQVFPERVYYAHFKGYEFFRGQNGERVLVMLLRADAVADRHLALMEEYEFSYDFPLFHPHLTLHYNYPDNSLLGLPEYDKPISLGLEYTEDIDFV